MHQPLSQIIENFRRTRILVMGDYMLDEFLFGEISRVSREAPVLILKYQEASFRPGGAGNTLANVLSLGAAGIPAGFVGDDTWADRLFSFWPPSVKGDFLFRDPTFSTTRKTRILAGSFHSFRQQVVRMDYESPIQLDSEKEERLLKALESSLSEVDAVIVSDYSLGNLTRRLRRQIIARCREGQVPVVVDSRDHPADYQGATAITPNIAEVETALGKEIETDPEAIESACQGLCRLWSVDWTLITRGKKGMSLVGPGSALHIPAFGSQDAVDVTGAGDTVVATFTAGLAGGASPQAAARLANYAGGIVVMKKGTATVSSQELLDAVSQESSAVFRMPEASGEKA